MRNCRRSKNKRAFPKTAPLALALGAALSGSPLVASANTTTTILGSTTSNYTLSGAEDFKFSSIGTITTSLPFGLGVDSSVTNSTITLDAGGKLYSSSGIGLQNNGQVNLIDNNGIVSGAQTAIDNSGSIVLIRNAGTISGANAIVNSGALGTISNSGTISGNISNTSSVTLTVTGGGGTTVGTFTGQSGVGVITNENGDIEFAGGNIQLNDNVDVGGHTAINSGAAISLINAIDITGNYSQSAGSLALESGATLSVSGTASLTGGTVSVALDSTGNYLAGDSVSLISAASLNVSGVTFNANGPGESDVSSAVTATSLAAQFNNDYIGGTLASATVSGAISSTNGVYIAGTGSLGTLLVTDSGSITGSGYAIYNAGTLGTISNAGTVSGNIGNGSSDTLTIVGGGGATVGTFTGLSGVGTIGNTAGNIDFAGGNILLNDNVDVASNTVTNTGASIRLNNDIDITGNYSQSAGALTLANGATLNVSGAASFSGGTVSSSLDATANYLAGDSLSLISAGSLSSSGAAVDIAGLTPGALAVSSVVTGTSLGIRFDNDYIGGTLASATVNGTISSSNGVYVASTGNLGTLTVGSSGNISGSGYAIYNAGTLGAISNAGSINGNINLGNSSLTITGGSGSIFGTLAGGTISSAAAQLTLGSGNLLLDDEVVLASGSGTLVSSGGVLQINGPRTLAGNYYQDASATLLIGVSDAATATGSTTDTGYGRLTVSGNATIASGSAISLATTGASYSFASGQRYVVIVADGIGTDYNASSLNYSATGFGGVVTGAQVADGANSDLVLTLGSGAPVNGATLGNSVQALGGLFNYTGTQPLLLNLFNAAAAIGADSSTANAVGAQLSPVGMASANFLVSMASSQAIAGILHNRLGQLRNGLSSGDETLDNTAWIQVFGNHVDQGERDGLSGYRADFSGLMIGADRMLGNRWQAGGAVSYSTSTLKESDANQGSSVDGRSFGVHGYAGYDADNWYLNLDASVARAHYDSRRVVDFSGFYGQAKGGYNGTQYGASTEAGWPIRLGQWRDTTLTPIVNLTYSRLEQSGYTESEGNGAALTVNSVGDDSFTSQLGARLEHKYDTSWGAMASYIRLGWRHEYLNTRLQTTASYAGDTSGVTSFTNQGAAPLRDTAVLAIGTTLVESQRLSASGQLQFDGGDGYQSYSANLTLRYRF